MYQVFRIEPKHKDIFLYKELRLTGNYTRLIDLHQNKKFPSAWEDYDNLYNFIYDLNTRFCVNNFCQLLYWFGTEYENLYKDFNICLYKVSNIVIGKSGFQSYFNTDDIIEKIIINK